MTTVEQKPKRMHVGLVVSDKMDKTIVVKIERVFTHQRIHRTLKTSRKYKVHDEQGIAKAGDVVEFYEGRPVSKTKYMYLSRVVQPALVAL